MKLKYDFNRVIENKFYPYDADVYDYTLEIDDIIVKGELILYESVKPTDSLFIQDAISKMKENWSVTNAEMNLSK